MKTLALILFSVLLSVNPGRASTIPDAYTILEEVAECAKKSVVTLQIQLLTERAILEAQLDKREEALTKLQNLRNRIKDEIREGQLNSLSVGLLYLAWQQGKVNDWSGQKTTLSLFREVASGEKTIQNVARAFFQKYDYTFTSEQKTSLRPVLKELSTLLSRIPSESPESLNILVLQNMLIRAYAALGDQKEILNIIRFLEKKIRIMGNDPVALDAYRLIIAKAWARLGEVKKVESFLEQRSNQIADITDIAKIDYAGKKIELADHLVDAGYDQAGERLLTEVLVFLQPLYSAIKDLKRRDISAFLMPVTFRMANIQGKLGKSEKVWESLNTIKELGILDENLPMDPIVFLVEHQLKAGEIENARKTAQSATPNIRSEIAMLQARYGDIHGANESYEVHEFYWASAASLQAYLKEKDITERPVLNQEMVRVISSALANSGDFQKAYLWGRNQPTDDLKAFALLGTVEGMIQNTAQH